MCILKSNCNSITGKFIYSDQYFLRVCGDGNRPFLNELASILVMGIAAGIIRSTLAILHIIGHLFASLMTGNSGHFAHVFKGGTELVRGLIEAMPIIGRIFSWLYNGTSPLFFIPITHICEGEYRCNWFIIKIYNPDAPDFIDEVLKGRNLIK